MLRYDTLGNFNSATGWQGVNVSAFSGTATDGATPWSSFGSTSNSAFDGRYFYFLGNAAGGAGQVFAFDTSSNLGSYALKYTGFMNDGLGTSKGGLSFTVNAGSSALNVGALPTLSAGTWNHLAATYDGSQLTLYLNGTLMASRSGSGTMTSSSSNLTLGSLTPDGLGLLNGSLQDLQIYNRALSASEIQNIATLGLCK